MKRLRIVADGRSGGTKIFDADTGEAILHATRVTFEHDALHIPRVTVELACVDGIELDVRAEADFLKTELPPEGSNTVSSIYKQHRPPKLGGFSL